MVELELVVGDSSPKLDNQTKELMPGRLQVFLADMDKEQEMAVTKFKDEHNKITVIIKGS